MHGLPARRQRVPKCYQYTSLQQARYFTYVDGGPSLLVGKFLLSYFSKPQQDILAITYLGCDFPALIQKRHQPYPFDNRINTYGRLFDVVLCVISVSVLGQHTRGKYLQRSICPTSERYQQLCHGLMYIDTIGRQLNLLRPRPRGPVCLAAVSTHIHVSVYPECRLPAINLTAARASSHCKIVSVLFRVKVLGIHSRSTFLRHARKRNIVNFVQVAAQVC